MKNNNGNVNWMLVLVLAYNVFITAVWLEAAVRLIQAGHLVFGSLCFPGIFLSVANWSCGRGS